MDLEIIKDLFIELEIYLKKYGDNSILPSYKIVKNTVEILLSHENDDMKKEIVINNYKKLFPGKGALSEFYVWDDDLETRKKLNLPFEKIHNELWDSLKNIIC